MREVEQVSVERSTERSFLVGTGSITTANQVSSLLHGGAPLDAGVLHGQLQIGYGSHPKLVGYHYPGSDSVLLYHPPDSRYLLIRLNLRLCS